MARARDAREDPADCRDQTYSMRPGRRNFNVWDSWGEQEVFGELVPAQQWGQGLGPLWTESLTAGAWTSPTRGTHRLCVPCMRGGGWAV